VIYKRSSTRYAVQTAARDTVIKLFSIKARNTATQKPARADSIEWVEVKISGIIIAVSMQ